MSLCSWEEDRGYDEYDNESSINGLYSLSLSPIPNSNLLMDLSDVRGGSRHRVDPSLPGDATLATTSSSTSGDHTPPLLGSHGPSSLISSEVTNALAKEPGSVDNSNNRVCLFLSSVGLYFFYFIFTILKLILAASFGTRHRR